MCCSEMKLHNPKFIRMRGRRCKLKPVQKVKPVQSVLKLPVAELAALELQAGT